MLVVPEGSATPPSAQVHESPSQRPSRQFSRWSRRYTRRLAAADAVTGFLAAAVPSAYSHTLNGWTLVVLALTAAVVWPLAIAFGHGYDARKVGVGTHEMRAVLQSGVRMVVLGAFPAGLADHSAFLKLAVVWSPLAVILSVALRCAARGYLHRQQRQGRNVRRVVVAGSSAGVRQLTEQLRRDPFSGMKVIGACVPATEIGEKIELGVPVLGDLDDVSAVIHASNCDALAVTSGYATGNNYLRRLSWSLEGTDVEFLVDPGLIEVAGPRMHIRPVVGVPLLHVEEPQFSGSRRIIKRVTDILLTVVGLIFIAPLLAAIAVAIKIQDGGPVIFRQVRIGRHGEPFTMLKFRTMIPDAEERKSALLQRNEGNGLLFKMAQDPRITRLGYFLRRFSLDELPQLFNVVGGSMSLVGPRPHLEKEIAAMPTDAMRRSLVTPGLTGLWQVSGRSTLSAEDSVRLDLRYVENWSLTLDLLILCKTTFAVLARKGAM